MFPQSWLVHIERLGKQLNVFSLLLLRLPKKPLCKSDQSDQLGRFSYLFIYPDKTLIYEILLSIVEIKKEDLQQNQSSIHGVIIGKNLSALVILSIWV